MSRSVPAADDVTAAAFAASWNTLPRGSVYTRAQVEEWLAPIAASEIRGARVLELGCGNASLLVHVAAWSPSFLEGVDLGESVRSATANMASQPFRDWRITRADLTEFDGGSFDLVYCIGVLHHLKDPLAGFRAVVRNVRDGGRFHCWVYAREGNAVVRWLVDPLRRVVSRLPWRFTKYAVALPLSIPFFVAANLIARLPETMVRRIPLGSYCRWIAAREFRFFWHVAFDQLVTPQTAYLPKHIIEGWLRGQPEIDASTAYFVFRNGNSWKFGARVRRGGA